VNEHASEADWRCSSPMQPLVLSPASTAWSTTPFGSAAQDCTRVVLFTFVIVYQMVGMPFDCVFHAGRLVLSCGLRALQGCL
jgi:hypothetical protein